MLYTGAMRYLGIDFGSKRVGLALSDEAGVMGFPHSILSNSPRLIDEVCALISKERVGAVVVGESRDLSGADNPIAADARAFGARIAERTGVPVAYESEVFTSEEARQVHHKEEKSRAPQKREHIDDSAAAIILTSYLSRKL
jgi:putative holliday junction resolvase